MSRASAIYEGVVRHRRFAPVEHALRFRMFMMYLDLDELPTLFDGLWAWSCRRPALARWKRSDFLAGASDLRDEVRARVRSAGARCDGPIRMLTHLRYFGHIFNPVTFYYCFDPAGERVESVLSEITNTPWKERHAYVVPHAPEDRAGLSRRRFRKGFHVSPFMPMNLDYDWLFKDPGDRLFVQMNLLDGGRRHFDATLSLRRREITPSALRGALARYPLMTARVVARIYWEAWKLKRKGAPVYANPSTLARRAAAGGSR